MTLANVHCLIPVLHSSVIYDGLKGIFAPTLKVIIVTVLFFLFTLHNGLKE